eukprot:gene9082-1177_t
MSEKQTINRDNWSTHPKYHSSRASFLVRIHNSFRQAFVTIAQLLEEKKYVQAGREYYNLKYYLHNHHSIEEHIMFPSLAEQMKNNGENACIVQSLYTDHDDMNKMMDELTKLYSDQNKFEEIPAKWKKFSDHMMKHLNDEEDISIPIMIKYGIDI